jgi:hypothetical protein
VRRKDYNPWSDEEDDDDSEDDDLDDQHWPAYGMSFAFQRATQATDGWC